MDHRVTISFHHKQIIYIKDQVEQFRAFFELQPLHIEVHDRDPLDTQITAVNHGVALMWLNDFTVETQRSVSLTVPVTHTLTHRPAPQLENEEKKKPQQKKEEIKVQLQPVLPSVPTKEIPKGNYSECNTLVSITVRLSSPLPSPSPEQLKLAVIILLQNDNFEFAKEVHKIIESYIPITQQSETPVVPKQQVLKPKESAPAVSSENLDMFSGFELNDGDSRIIVIESMADRGAKYCMQQLTHLQKKSNESDELSKRNGTVKILFNPNFKYSKRLYPVSAQEKKLQIIRLKESIIKILLSNKQFFKNSHNNKQIVDCLIRLDQLREAETIRQVAYNRLLPNNLVLTEIGKMYGDSSLLQQDEHNILQERERKFKEEEEKIFTKRQMEELDQQKRDAELQQREVVQYLDDLQYHVNRDITMDGFILQIYPNNLAPLNLCKLPEQYSHYSTLSWMRIPIKERPDNQLLSSKGHNYQLSKQYERLPRNGHILIAFQSHEDANVTKNEFCIVRGTLICIDVPKYSFVFCILCEEYSCKAAPKVETWIPSKFIRHDKFSHVTNHDNINKKKIVELSEQSREKRESNKETTLSVQLPQDDGEVYIYSSQKKKWTEEQLKALRAEVKKHQNAFITYSKEYMSLAVQPLSEKEVADEIQGKQKKSEGNAHGQWNKSTKILS